MADAQTRSLSLRNRIWYGLKEIKHEEREKKEGERELQRTLHFALQWMNLQPGYSIFPTPFLPISFGCTAPTRFLHLSLYFLTFTPPSFQTPPPPFCSHPSLSVWIWLLTCQSINSSARSVLSNPPFCVLSFCT